MIRKKKSKSDKINNVNEFEAEVDDSVKDPLNLQEEGITYVDTHKKKISKKKIALVAVIVLAAGAGIGTFLVKNIHGGNEGKVYVESVSYVAGLESDSGLVNRYTGIVEVQDSWKITLDEGLSVEKCFVKVGDEVKKGDKLFSYNTEELRLNQEKKELELQTMQNENTQLTKDIETYNKDLNSASASEKIELRTQILTAQTTIKKNEFSIKAAKDEISKLKKNIKDATVKSKMAGVVKSINKSLGNVSSGDEDDSASYSEDGSDASVYMNILAVGDYRVKGKINETNASSITEGQAVIIRSRVDDRTWSGNVSKIKTDATADDTQTTDSMDGEDGTSTETASSYNFYVSLENDDGLMMGQHVFIEPDQGQDTEREGIWLSSAYILVDDDKYYVWIDDGHERLKKKEVTIGEYDEELDEYQIKEGLKADDYIANDDIDLKEGTKTTKVDPYSEENMEEGDTEAGDLDEGGVTETYDDVSDSGDAVLSDDELEDGEEYIDDFSGTDSDFTSTDDDSDSAE